MPRRIAASATRLPILPRPTMPSVCPGSSDPANCFLPSSTRLSMSEPPSFRLCTTFSAAARPTAFSEGPNSCLCRSAERTRIACGSFASFTTVYCSAGRRFRPTWAMVLSTRISHFLLRALAMLGFEFLHVLEEPLHALERHGVVDRGAHAADRAVALQLDHPALGRPLQEGFIQRSVF